MRDHTLNEPTVQPTASVPPKPDQPAGRRFQWWAYWRGLILGPFAIPLIWYGLTHAKQAASATRSWLSWAAGWATIAIPIIILLIIGSATAPGTTSTSLEKSITSAGPWSDGSTVTTAHCVAASTHNHGAGTYQCYLTFNDGTKGVKAVTVDGKGNWVAGN